MEQHVVDRSTRVMRIHRWISAAAGITKLFFIDQLVHRLSDDDELADAALERYLPGPSKMIVQSWGISVLFSAYLAHAGLSFSSSEERLIVCRANALTFLIGSFLYLKESFVPTSNPSWRGVYSVLFPLSACLCAAYTWASLEDVPTNPSRKTITTTISSAERFLARVFYCQTVVSTSVGLLTIFWPPGLFVMDASTYPNPTEAFAVRCWGAFILPVGAVCFRAPTAFALRSRVAIALGLTLHFFGLACLYLFKWEQLNFSYRYGSVPFNIPLTVLWIFAISRVAMEEAPLSSSSSSREKRE